MSEEINYKKTKLACFFSFFAMAPVFALPPLLFVTFRETFGISYTLLGTLVLVNFCTQLGIDLIFTFFSKHFNIKKTVVAMPVLTTAGLVIYATVPWLFPEYAYAGLVAGTIIFSVSAGLSEVLVSPIFASIPSDDPKKVMSLLHSAYAYSVVTVVVLSTVFLKLFSSHMWMYLVLFWAIVPLISFWLYLTSPLPDVNVSSKGEKVSQKGRAVPLMLCTICIFLGGASENTMTNWISGFTENALEISKIWGDILGMTTFAILLGIGRSLYAKSGKSIVNSLILGMSGAALCYILTGLTDSPALSVVGCIMTGFFTAMLWPGSLIMMEEILPGSGVGAYALMAAGGDFGSSVAPQMLGIVVDKVSASSWACELSGFLALSPEQIGMKIAMVVTAIFPILGVIVLLYIKKHCYKNRLIHNNIRKAGI